MSAAPPRAAHAALTASGLVQVYRGRDGTAIRAVDDVSLHVQPREILAIVGESGSGKSTLGRLLALLETPLAGTVQLGGASPSGAPGLNRGELRDRRRRVQMVFQNSAGALDPRQTIRSALREARRIQGLPRSEDSHEIKALLERVELGADVVDKRPRELSGGQRQRVALARALAVRPDVLIADEPTSALDVSVQAHIVSLLTRISRDDGVALVWISHDLPLVESVADRVCVLFGGRVIESGRTSDVFERPAHPYTRALLQAAWGTDQPTEPNPTGAAPTAAAPDAVAPPAASACGYTTQCPWTLPQCRSERPPLLPVARDEAAPEPSTDHRAACWLKSGG